MKITFKNPIKSFTIKESIWARGGKKSTSMLLNSMGNMCCLGQWAKACGFTYKEILCRYNPGNLYNKKDYDLNSVWTANLEQKDIVLSNNRSLYKKQLTFYNSANLTTKIGSKLITDNDREDISDFERKKLIKKHFAKLGVKVKFVK